MRFNGGLLDGAKNLSLASRTDAQRNQDDQFLGRVGRSETLANVRSMRWVSLYSTHSTGCGHTDHLQLALLC
jgi:hypothetical protein